MRRLLLIGLALVVLTAGCKKTANKTDSGASGSQPSVHAPSGVVIHSGASGGSGGAAQAVRKAAMSAVTRHEMEQIHILIENASTATGQIPSAKQISAELQKAAPKTWKLIQEGAIVLTDTRSAREHLGLYQGNTE